jgi:hypothetical protein
MKAKAILILLVVTLAAMVCLHLDDFGLSNSTTEASLLPERSGRTYSEVATLTITVDGLTKSLFERKIRECTPWGYEEGVRLGISTKELFDRVYESLGWKTLEKYDRQQCDAMTDIALDDMVEKRQVEYDYDIEQWRQGHSADYEMKHWTDWTGMIATE